MISFEFSIIDIVLLIAVIALFALHITKSSTKPSSAQEPPPKRPLPERTVRPLVSTETSQSSEEALPTTSVGTEDPTKCTHQYGYLRSLPKDAQVPEECFTCPKYVRCAITNE